MNPIPPLGRPALQQFVMMPLEPITNWEAFRAGIRHLKQIGVSGVTTDICWGLVEKRAGDYDWVYYQKLGALLAEEKMPWVTILSTHAIGGNVGDNVDIPLSDEVLDRIPGAEYVYQNGLRNRETISYFASEPEASAALQSFYASFKANIFDRFHANIAKIYVGMGPASEARYPSYGEHLGYPYPSEGGLPVYSTAALSSFRAYLRDRYRSVEALNEAWNLNFKSFDGELAPQMPQEPASVFLQNARGSRYYRDFMDWYSATLVTGVNRGLKALSLAWTGRIEAIGPLFAIKVAGLHWQRLNPSSPRATEIAAGYERYEPLFFAAREWQVGITFTCLEMEKTNDAGYPRYSDPPGLVNEIIDVAKRMNVKISGENALEFGHPAPLRTVRRIVEAQNALGGFHGFTFLRWHQLVSESGALTDFAREYQEILVQPATLKIQYFAFRTQGEIDALGLEIFLVPVDPQTLEYQWAGRVPLRARGANADVFHGELRVVDREAQLFAVGAVAKKSGVRIQLTSAQPLSAVSHSLGTLALNPLMPRAIWPRLDRDLSYGDVATFKSAVESCEKLLDAPAEVVTNTIHRSLRRQRRLDGLESAQLQKLPFGPAIAKPQ